jgi:HAD superfamily hydrolase (TIGR01509 family)
MAKYSAVIFDLDGVILDTEPMSREGWKYAMAKVGRELTDEVFQKIIGLGIKNIEKFFKEIFGRDFPYEQVQQLRREYVKKYVEENGIAIKPGVLELLDFLDKVKLPKAIATSTSKKSVMHNLSRVGLAGRFETIVCGDEIENGKPKPDIFLKAADKLGVSPKECLAFEDSDNGTRAAYAAEMTVIMIPDLKQPGKELMPFIHKVLPSLHEAIPFLREVNKGN